MQDMLNTENGYFFLIKKLASGYFGLKICVVFNTKQEFFIRISFRRFTFKLLYTVLSALWPVLHRHNISILLLFMIVFSCNLTGT